MPRLRPKVDPPTPGPGELDYRFRRCRFCDEVFRDVLNCSHGHPRHGSEVYRVPLALSDLPSVGPGNEQSIPPPPSASERSGRREGRREHRRARSSYRRDRSQDRETGASSRRKESKGKGKGKETSSRRDQSKERDKETSSRRERSKSRDKGAPSRRERSKERSKCGNFEDELCLCEFGFDYCPRHTGIPGQDDGNSTGEESDDGDNGDERKGRRRRSRKRRAQREAERQEMLDREVRTRIAPRLDLEPQPITEEEEAAFFSAASACDAPPQQQPPLPPAAPRPSPARPARIVTSSSFRSHGELGEAEGSGRIPPSTFPGSVPPLPLPLFDLPCRSPGAPTAPEDEEGGELLSRAVYRRAPWTSAASERGADNLHRLCPPAPPRPPPAPPLPRALLESAAPQHPQWEVLRRQFEVFRREGAVRNLENRPTYSDVSPTSQQQSQPHPQQEQLPWQSRREEDSPPHGSRDRSVTPRPRSRVPLPESTFFGTPLSPPPGIPLPAVPSDAPVPPSSPPANPVRRHQRSNTVVYSPRWATPPREQAVRRHTEQASPTTQEREPGDRTDPPDKAALSGFVPPGGLNIMASSTITTSGSSFPSFLTELNTGSALGGVGGAGSGAGASGYSAGSGGGSSTGVNSSSTVPRQHPPSQPTQQQHQQLASPHPLNTPVAQGPPQPSAHAPTNGINAGTSLSGAVISSSPSSFMNSSGFFGGASPGAGGGPPPGSPGGPPGGNSGGGLPASSAASAASGGAAFGAYPMPAGQQMDLNYLWQQVQELGAVLAHNRESTQGIIRRVSELQRRAATETAHANVAGDNGATSDETDASKNAAGTGMSMSDVLRALNGEQGTGQTPASTSTAGAIPSTTAAAAATIAELQEHTESLVELNAQLNVENNELASLVSDYEAGVGRIVEMVRNFAYQNTMNIQAIHRSYTDQLAQERATNLELRQQHFETQAGLRRVAAVLRDGLRHADDDEEDDSDAGLMAAAEAVGIAEGADDEGGSEGSSGRGGGGGSSERMRHRRRRQPETLREISILAELRHENRALRRIIGLPVEESEGDDEDDEPDSAEGSGSADGSTRPHHHHHQQQQQHHEGGMEQDDDGSGNGSGNAAGNGNGGGSGNGNVTGNNGTGDAHHSTTTVSVPRVVIGGEHATGTEHGKTADGPGNYEGK